ncbi:probable tocopherol O-methyltransferase, chloroplastic [Amborella trichopoda]|uniref:Methyltransferase type 11 domain-containing protein n=1 Tax=Amborella trichopoda TaxID=13333 RepID=U5CR58_AMBTC|nr:probable tocopherol O-methyltransferase, chloroplastic [Amborella trichopoda]ERN15686.1 hypothetical protein AMTR_s00048p00220930 [Amborella trichopoda]|eukprot:XP_006854219.1 probable tocopherol O-methyltransferase, chloroplastic [Amborella trichopoda]
MFALISSLFATIAWRARLGFQAPADDSTLLWRELWRDHFHHGYYDTHATPSLADHRLSQTRTIDEALAFAGITDDESTWPRTVIDVGCGVGGSARYIAKKLGAKCEGITVDPNQVKIANDLALAQGLADKATFHVADAMDQPFADGQFDLVWVMESGEHMPDRKKFMSELVRVVAPGGTIIIASWCHRDLSPDEKSLRPDELHILNRACNAYEIPAWCSMADYINLAQSFSLQDIKTADWSDNIAPFWPVILRSSFTFDGLTSLFKSGWKTIKLILGLSVLKEGYDKKLIKFAIMTCRKPE